MRDLSGLSDEQLLRVLEDLVEKERGGLADFLAHLAEADRRIATRQSPWPSTFAYCTRKLRLSEDEAYRRITAARAAKDHPEIYSYIREGKLSLTAVSRLSGNLRGDVVALLETASGKPIRDVAALVAPLVRGKTPAARIRPIKRVLEAPGPLFEVAQGREAVIEADEYIFQAPRELREIIDRAKELLWHKYPFGQLDGILLEWGREWAAKHDPLKRPAPKISANPAGTNRPPAWARHAVWKRDGGRCAFVSDDGRRCEARRALELDHVVPRSLGGLSGPENLRLLCRPHNDSERRRALGEGTV